MTDDARSLGRRPSIDYYIERKTSAPIGGEPVQRAKEAITPEMVTKLTSNVSKLIGKIGKLQDEIKRTTREWIPVHEQAYEVRHALRQLFPGRPEDKIFFDEYVSSLEYQFSRTNINSMQLISMLTGNSEVDSRLIDQAQWAAGDGIDVKELAIITGQMLLLRVANMILQPESSKDAADIAAPKLYPGTERAPMAAKVLIGLAALLLQIAENVDSVKDLLKESVKGTNFEGMDTDAIVAQAMAQGPNESVSRYDKSKRPYYNDTISRYSNDYLAATQEPGYEGWSSYSALEAYRSEFQQTHGEMTGHGDPTQAYLGAVQERSEGITAAYEMSRDIYRYILYRAVSANDQVNQIAAILSSKLTSDVLCCLVIFVGSIPTQQLKLLRFALSVAANGLSYNMNSAISGMASRVNSYLAEQFLEPVLHSVDKTYNKFVSQILAILDKNRWADQETYDAVMKCTPVDMVLELGFYGLDQLKRYLKFLITKAWRRVEVKQVKGDFSWRVMADCKWAKTYLRILDKVIESVERGNLCAREGGNTPSADEIEDLTNRLAEGMSPAIRVPVGEGNPFEVFALKEFNSSLGFPVQASESQPEGEALAPVKFRIADCMRQNASPQQILKALGLSVQVSRDMRYARNIEKSRPSS